MNTIVSISLISVLLSGCMGTTPKYTKADHRREDSAKHIRASQDTLLELSKDNVWFVRCAVAENKNTSSEVLTDLANDENHYVRYDVAKNPNTPIKVLNQLTNDKYLDVRLGVILNQNASEEVLSKVYRDYLNLSEKDKEGFIAINMIPRNIAYHQNTSSNTLLKLYKKHSDDLDAPGVVVALAKNRNTPVELLEELAKDGNSEVKRNLAWNTGTPVELLKKLAKDEDRNVRNSVAQNINTPIEILNMIIEDDKSSYVRQTAYENPKIKNPRLEKERAEKTAKDKLDIETEQKRKEKVDLELRKQMQMLNN